MYTYETKFECELEINSIKLTYEQVISKLEAYRISEGLCNNSHNYDDPMNFYGIILLAC